MNCDSSKLNNIDSWNKFDVCTFFLMGVDKRFLLELINNPYKGEFDYVERKIKMESLLDD